MNQVRGKVKARQHVEPVRYSRWFRYYTEALHDPKIVLLSDRQFRSWVGILCIAAQCGGRLPSIRDIAAHLRMTCPDTEEQINDLINAGLIDIGRDGVRVPHNWHLRQFVSDTSTERVRRHRETKRNADETFHETNGNVSASVYDSAILESPRTKVVSGHEEGERGSLEDKKPLVGFAGRCDTKYRNNTSGFPGVSRHKNTGRWQALLGHGGRNYHLGLFDTAQDAHDAYVSACDDPMSVRAIAADYAEEGSQ